MALCGAIRGAAKTSAAGLSAATSTTAAGGELLPLTLMAELCKAARKTAHGFRAAGLPVAPPGAPELRGCPLLLLEGASSYLNG